VGTLADAGVLATCCERLTRLEPSAPARWGRMNAHQMVCHLRDSFECGLGQRYASPDSNWFKRTIMKWGALRAPIQWPHGVATRPEMEQGRGGTPPADWERDCAGLREIMLAFSSAKKFGVHPIFGPMSQEEWLIWGYRHVDHHFRQFGV